MMLNLLLLVPIAAHAAGPRAVSPIGLPASAVLAPLAPAAPSPDLQLFSAAKAGDLAGMERAVAAGARLDAAQAAALNQTPILAAAAAGKAEAVRWLADRGADRNVRDALKSTPAIYAAMRGDLATLDALRPADGLDVLALDLQGRSAFDHARATGRADVEARLNEGVKALDERAGPEHYLVVNFLGMGGGGRIESGALEKDRRVAHVFHLERSRADQRLVRERIQSWMETDLSRGGPRAQNLVIVGSSWGSAPAASLARWFREEFGFAPRLHVFVEGATLLGLPNRSMGPAAETRDYHVEGWHWPRGGAAKNADENVSLGDMSHDEGLFVGAARAAEDIEALLARKIARTAQALRDRLWAEKLAPTEYDTLPTERGGWRNALKALRAFLTVRRTFDTDSDALPRQRGGYKLLHPFGTTLKVRYAPRPGANAPGALGKEAPGLVRLSLGQPEASGTFIPGVALKLFQDGAPSLNAVFLGERTGVDGQAPDKDFFAQAFTNDLPPARSRANKLAAFVLGLFNKGNALRVPTDHFGAPVLRLVPAAGLSYGKDPARDFRDNLASLKPGPLLEVWAGGVHVGDLLAESAPVASEYGDTGLFFRHRRGR